MSQQQCLDIDKIYEILQEEKPNQREQIKLPMERIGKYFPENFTPSPADRINRAFIKRMGRNESEVAKREK